MKEVKKGQKIHIDYINDEWDAMHSGMNATVIDLDKKLMNLEENDCQVITVKTKLGEVTLSEGYGDKYTVL